MEMQLHHDESRYAAYLIEQIGLIEAYVYDNSIPSGVRRRAAYLLANLYAEMVRITQPVINQLFTIKMGILCIG